MFVVCLDHTTVTSQRGELIVDNEVVDYQWVRSRRRRHIHLVLDERDGLQIRTPWDTSIDEVESLIARQTDWVRRALALHEHRQTERAQLVNGVRLPLIDDELELALGVGRRPRVSRRGNLLMVQVPEPQDELIRDALERWYREQAKILLSERLNNLAEQHGFSPGAVTIRGQRRRWGSCNSQGDINLNWRLLLLPSELVDYVLMHELCHLEHMDHSHAFWGAVRRRMPDYEARLAQVNALRASDLQL